MFTIGCNGIYISQYEHWPPSRSPAVPGSCQATSAAAGQKTKHPHSSARQQQWKRRERRFCISEFVCLVIKAHPKQHHLTAFLTEPKPWGADPARPKTLIKVCSRRNVPYQNSLGTASGFCARLPEQVEEKPLVLQRPFDQQTGSWTEPESQINGCCG